MTGRTIERYRILNKLGEGGMGVVYKAEDTRLRRTVALKFLSPNLAADEPARRRFLQEAQAAAALSHANICTIFEVNEEPPLLAMEFLEGRTVKEKIEVRPLPLEEAIEIAIEAAGSLRAAHAKGVVHRDVKPTNLMVTGEGVVKLMDFGLARLSDSSRLTEAGIVMGTPAYMSPEQSRGEAADARTDLWSLGVVLYEMVTGRRPFRGEGEAATVHAVLHAEPEPLTALRTGVPVELDRLVAKCLAKDPEDRYQHAGDLLVDLRAVARRETARAAETRKKLARRWVLTIAAASAAACAGIFLAVRRETPIDSVAVLPFHNAGDPSAEYLSDGISESLITALSRLPRLKVKSRDAVSRYKGQDKDARTVGREQGVRAVLKGRLLQRGDAFMLSVELVDTNDDTVLWRDQFERKIGELLALQEELSRFISAGLRLKLTGKEQRSLVSHQTENNEAYQLYLKGRYLWNLRTEEDLKKSVEFFDQAVQRDPGFARTWSGVADAYNMLAGYGVLPPRDAFPRAKAAAMKALAIDDALAEAHASLARVKSQYEWDWPGAEQEYQRAIALNPNYGAARHSYAIHLAAVGRPKEAIAEIKRARDAEPLSLVINGTVGWFHYIDKQYDRAIEESRRAIAMDPNFAWGHNALGSVYVQKGRYGEAIREFQQGLVLSRRGVIEMTYLAHAYAVSGQRREAQKLLDEFREMSQRRFVPPEYIAMIHTGLEDRERAFAYLEEGYAQRSLNTFFLPDPRFDPLRGDPRFRDLMRRMGLQEPRSR